MSSLQKSIQYNVVGKFLYHLLVFANNVMITRILGTAFSGYFFNELYILSFLVFLCGFGFDYSLVYLLSKKQINIIDLCKKLLIISIFSALLIKILCIFRIINLNQPHDAIFLFSVGNWLLVAFQAILSAYSKFLLQNIVLVSANLILLILLLVLYHPFHMDQPADKHTFDTIAITVGSMYFLQGFILLFIIRFANLASSSFIISWKELLSSGLLMMISALIFFVYLRVDNFFVEKYCDATTLSNYVQCGKIGQYFLYLPTIVSSTLLPYYVKNDQQLSFAHWKKMVQPYIYILLFTVAVLAIGGSYIFPFLFGKEFGAMYTFMIILLPGFFALGILTLVNTVFFSKKNLITIIIGDIIGLFLIIVLDFIFVPKYGALAAAIISSFSYIATLGYLLVHLKKQFSNT